MRKEVDGKIYDTEESVLISKWLTGCNEETKVFKTKFEDVFEYTTKTNKDGTIDAFIETKKDHGKCIGCRERGKDLCSCVSNELKNEKRVWRQKRFDKFKDKLLPKLEALYQVEYLEKLKRYKITTKKYGVVNYFPKSKKVYLFNEKRWEIDGLFWIKNNLVDKKPMKFNNQKFKIGFGKYKGRLITEMVSPEEIRYCQWAFETMSKDLSKEQKKRSEKYNAFYFHLFKKTPDENQ